MTITCAQCGKARIVSPCREGLNHCCRACYLASLELDPVQVGRMARQGISRQEAAKRLSIPFPTFYRKLRRQGMNDLFPSRGQHLRYIA